MKEIRIHGRGGQGSIVLAELMAVAALEDGKYGQSFPFLGGGGERKGKPIMAFCRLCEQPIRIRSRVNEPDYVIVQDATILEELDVTQGIKEGGMILVNSDKNAANLNREGAFHVYTFSADTIARKIIKKGLTNTALLGAFAALTKELSLDAVVRAVEHKFSAEMAQKNIQILRSSYFLFSREK